MGQTDGRIALFQSAPLGRGHNNQPLHPIMAVSCWEKKNSSVICKIRRVETIQKDKSLTYL